MPATIPANWIQHGQLCRRHTWLRIPISWSTADCMRWLAMVFQNELGVQRDRSSPTMLAIIRGD